MKGDIEWKVLLGIILLAILFILIISIFVLPVISTGEIMPEIRDFRWYCIFWGSKGYSGTTVTIDEEEISMNPHCTRALGILCFDPNGCLDEDDPYNEDWENCRNLCRVRSESE